MSLLKVLVVLSLLMVASCYGDSNQRYRVDGERSRTASKWRDVQHEDKLARIKYWWYVPEWKYRLDEVPCYGTAIPPANKAYHYFAPVYYLWYYHSYYCYASKLSTQGLFNDSAYSSWNFMSPGNNFYPSRRLSYYHVSCPDKIQFIVMNKFELQGKVRINYNERKCVDYVKIIDMSDESINKEFCSTQTLFQQLTVQEYTHDALVIFRSSRYNNYAGFAIRAACVSNSSSSPIMEDCLKVDNSEYIHVAGFDNRARKNVPKCALRKLQSFLHRKKTSEDGVWIMSDDEAVWNTGILSLAVLSERSCDAEYKRAGKAVLNLFPQWMVKKEREDYMKDADFKT